MFRFERRELQEPATSGFFADYKVRFQDVDAAGIVFYPRIFEYCHDVYLEFLESKGQPLSKALAEGAWAAPIRHAEADYSRPFRFGDTLKIGIVRVHLEATEMTLGFQLSVGQTVHAVAQSVHTFVRRTDFSRMPIPEDMRVILESLPR